LYLFLITANRHVDFQVIGFLVAKFKYEWFLFDYEKGYPDRISKPFKTKAAAEKARGKYPPKVRGGIGVGISQIPITTAKRKPKRRSSLISRNYRV
jgi:hypothetical protein